MSICQVMIMDFMLGTGRYDDQGEELYSDRDLMVGKDYALDCMEFDGETVEAHHGYNLAEFNIWCTKKLFPTCPDCRIGAACVHDGRVR